MMLSVSGAARLVVGSHLINLIKSSSSIAAAFSTLPSSARSIVKPVAPAFNATVISRGLASRAGRSSNKKSASSSKRSSSKSKSSKSSSSKRSSSTARGVRSAKKAAKSKAVQKKLKQALAARLAQKAKVRKAKQARHDRDVKHRATQRAKAREIKLKKMRSLMVQRQEKRRNLIAKNRTRREKLKTLESKRRLFQRVRELSARRRAALEKAIQEKLARARKFADAHPKLARARAAESRGLPPAPKLPLSAWGSFIKSNFGSAKSELTAAGNVAPKATEVIKVLAGKFKAQPEDVKAAQAAEQAKNKAAYELLKQQQQAQLPPKRPQSAYITYFVRRQKEIMRANPSLKLGDVSKQVADSWKTLNESERATLQADVAKATLAWKDLLASWADQHPGVQVTGPMRIRPTLRAIRTQLKEKQKQNLAAKAGQIRKNKKVASKKA